MERISISRHFDADPQTVRAAIDETAAFMRGAGFDEVRYEDGDLYIENRVGLFEIELELDVVPDDEAVLAYEQREGVFESMRTEYHVAPADGGTTVTAMTDYEMLDLAVVGTLLDASVVRRQRKQELEAQFDWLAEQVE